MADNNELFTAIAGGDLAVLQRVIAEHTNDPTYLNTTNSNGVTALFVACINNRADLVRALLNAGADGSLKCGRASAIHIAASKGFFEIVKLLVERGVPLEKRTDGPSSLMPGSTPLQLAATNGHVDVMLLLLSHYADVDDSLSNATAPDALQLASYHGRCDAVALLLAVGARFTPIDGGRSVFSIAFGNIHRGALHSTALATLVANGALAADTVTSGDSIDYNCADCATLIVAAGYEPTALDFKSHPESVVATCRRIALDPVRINAAQRRIVRVQIDLIRHRATEICIALRALDISALELCEIISTALPLSRFVKLHHIWAIVTIVKNKPLHQH